MSHAGTRGRGGVRGRSAVRSHRLAPRIARGPNHRRFRCVQIAVMSHAVGSTAVTTPASSGIRARLATVRWTLERFPLAIHQLLFRLAIAGIFLKAGLVKLASWQTTVALFRDEYKVPIVPPDVTAVLAATFELGCSLLLLLGFATRLATLPL